MLKKELKGNTKKKRVKDLVMLFIIITLVFLLVFSLFTLPLASASNANSNRNISMQDMQEYVERTQGQPTFEGFYNYMKNKGY